MQATLIIVDEDTGGDIHGINQYQALLDTTLINGILDITGNVYQSSSGRDMEKQFFSIVFHAFLLVTAYVKTQVKVK
jgi:hypothetical protein